MDPRIQEWIDQIERLQWVALFLDADWNLVWVSPMLKELQGATDEDLLGYGTHLLDAWCNDTWMRTVAPESQVEMLREFGPYILCDLQQRGRDPRDVLPDYLVPVLDEVEPKEPPEVLSSSMTYVDPKPDSGLASYKVNIFLANLRGEDGESYGRMMLFFVGMRPTLMELLVRGDEAMYERMAKLEQPGQREAVVLFCDLHRSGPMSRQLSTARYFRLVRELWTGIDQVVADETGIIGKHAGDGATAFFLVDDVGSRSGAAAAALRAARRIHEIGDQVFGEFLDEHSAMKVGVHWGSQLYMGQLIPGGRLDVTALGDEVNEAARLQECAKPGETLASKQLLERLDQESAAALGIDVHKIIYSSLADRDGAPDKAVRDAGGISAASV